MAKKSDNIMIDELEENSYFKNVVKDAIKDLTHNKVTYVFFQEQVDAIKDILKCELEVIFDGDFFRISLKEKMKRERKSRKH